MNEQDEIDQYDPYDPQIQDNIRAAQKAVSIFYDVCRMHPDSAPRDEDLDDIMNELYAKNGDIYDSVAWQLAWQRVRAQRQETERRETERDAQQQARTKEIEEFKAPASRAEAMRDLRAGHTAPSPAEFVPTREYSEEEIDNMSSDAYRRLVLGHVSIDDRQGRGTGRTVREERNALILADKVLNRAGISKTRSIKVSPEELAAREQRDRAIAQDKAERRRLEEQWRKK
jgi:hypothetical protein